MVPYHVTEHFTIPDARNLPLSVSSSSGDITVVRGSAQQIEVTIVKSSGTRAGLAQLHMHRKVNGTEVRLWTESQSCHWGCGDITYPVVVPAQTQLTLATSSGDVTVRGVTASVQVRDSSGDVRIDGAATVPKSWVHIRDSSGDISIANVAGSVRATTSSGNVSAPIRSLVGAQRIDLSTSSGDLSIALPRNPSARIRASTSSGSITSNLPLRVHGRYSQHWVRTTLGAGATDIHLATSSGDVSIESP